MRKPEVRVAGRLFAARYPARVAARGGVGEVLVWWWAGLPVRAVVSCAVRWQSVQVEGQLSTKIERPKQP